MFVNHAKIQQTRFERFKVALDQVRHLPEFEASFLDYVKSNYSDPDQQYFEAYSIKKKWDLPIHKLRTHQVSPNANRSSFAKRLKTLMDKPLQIEPVQRSKSVIGKKVPPPVQNPVPSKPPKLLDKEIQVSTQPQRKRTGLNSHELIPREYDNVVYFVHQIAQESGVKSFESTRSRPKLLDKQLRMRQYSRRVKQYFAPVQDKHKALNVHLRTETFISLKKLQEMPRMNLFKYNLKKGAS